MHSRREFLKLTGILLGGSQVGFNFIQAIAAEGTIYGRALTAVPIHRRADSNSQLVNHLWPDSVIPILDLRDDWYRVSGGYVRREGLQPVAPFTPSEVYIPHEPFWAEVSAPVAPIRDYCGAQAPLVTRIGHGGVAQIVDYLPDEFSGWYAVADDAGTIIGWSQAIYWQSVELDASHESKIYIEINLTTQQLTAWENEKAVLQAPCSTDSTMLPGRYPIHARNPGGTQVIANDSAPMHGVPWVTIFDQNLALGGVYWHNRFGENMPGMAVQVTPLIARWLYSWLGEDGEMRVI